MSLRFAEPWPLPLGFLAGGILVLFVVLTYRKLRAATDTRSRFMFLGLRIAAAVLLLLLILEPVLSRESLRTESLNVVVLVDRSRSMTVPDSYRGRARYRVAADFLHGEETGLVPLLGDGFHVMGLSFDSAVRPAAAEDLEGRTPPGGELTDLAAALAAAAQTGSEAETAAVVLLTDGAENAGGDSEAAAAALGVPVYAVGFGSRAGSETGRKDLAILSIEAPDTSFAENTVLAEASVRSTGYALTDEANRKVRVVLLEEERELAAEWVELTEDGVPVRVPLRFVPGDTGPHTFHVRLAVRGDEAVADNNSRSFPLNVLDRRASVLFFDAVMRWEAKFLRDFLARDPAVDLTSVLHSGQGRLMVNGDPHGADLSQGLPQTTEGFEKFDVIVLGDVEASALSSAQLDLLLKRVESGGGLLTLGGYHAYGAGGYAGTPLEDALPVSLDGGLGQREDEVSLSLTPEGRVHPALSGLHTWFSGREPPGLRGLTLVKREKPGAQVLLRTENDEIVLAAHRYGEGRAVSFTGDTSWVWFRSPDLGGPDGLYDRFWGQIIRWLLEKEPELSQAGEPFVVFTDRPSYRIGETVRVRARLRDAEGAPITDATLTALLDGPKDVRPLELSPVRRVPGQYETRFRALEPGPFRIVAKATRAGTTLGSAESEYKVENGSVEMDDIDLDSTRLSAIARASGGRYYHAPPTAKDVARDIRRSVVGIAEREELRLSNTPLFFLLFTGLLAAEWYLRRRRNLL